MRKIRWTALLLLVLLCGALVFVGCLGDKDGEGDTPSAGDPCAQGHSYVVEQVITAATCTQNGESRMVCSDCGEEKIASVPMTAHTPGEWVTQKAATCTQEGALEKNCIVCGERALETQVIPASGHTKGDWIEVTPATCLVPGLKQKNCTVCTATALETDEIPAPGHTKGDWIEATPATCLVPGVKQKNCTVCTATALETAQIPAPGHTKSDWIEVTPATCGTAGVKQKNCTVCTATGLELGEIPATGKHTKGEWVEVTPATCGAPGVKQKNCTVCTATALETEEIPATGNHVKSDWIEVTPATCGAAGLKQKNCTVCTATALETEEIPPSGEHIAGEWVEVTPASCEIPGVKQKNCTICTATALETGEIPATGHTKSDWIEVAPPTCLMPGIKQKNCTVCTATALETGGIPASGHSKSDWIEVTPATCTVPGLKQKNCTVCTATAIATEEIPAKGHDDGAWQEKTGDASRAELRCTRCQAVLRSANKEDVAIVSGSKTSIDLTGYRLVYPAGASDAFAAYVTKLAERLSAITGQTVKAVADTASAVSKEILIGRVNRTEATSALSDISGQGYTVQVVGSKIVITGSTNLTAIMGMQYFTNTYLAAGTASISIYQKAVSDGYATVTLGGAGNENYAVVYDKNLDTSTTESGKREDVYGSMYNGSTGRDFAYDAALAIQEKLYALTNQTVSLRKDSTTATAELLIGIPNRAVVATVLGELSPDQYGIVVRDGKVMVTGRSVEALRVALPLFLGLLEDAKTASGAILLPASLFLADTANDNWVTDITLPQGLPLYAAEDVGDGSFEYLYMGTGVSKSAYDAYCAALLREGYTVHSDSSMEGSYFKILLDPTGKEMLYVAYNAFAHANDASLVPSGLPSSWYTDTESNYAFTDPQIRIVSARLNAENPWQPKPGAHLGQYSRFAIASDTVEYIYYSTGYADKYSASITLLSYFNNDYRSSLTSAGYTILFESTAGDVPFYTAVNKSTGAHVLVELRTNDTGVITSKDASWMYLRVVFKKQGVVSLPEASALTPNQSYTKVTESKITSVALDANAVGTGYVITLEDGRFIVIDGGKGSNAPKQVWAVLKGLYTEIYGRAPSPEHPVEIAAWIITHGHSDHMNCLWDFANYYGGGTGVNKIETGGVVRLEYLIANQPELSTLYNTGEASLDLRYELRKFQDYFKYGFTFLKVHTGQKLYFANLELSVLFTQEDMVPQHIVNLNDTSVVSKLSLYSTTAAKNAKVSLTATAWQNDTASNPALTTFINTGDAYIHSGRWMCAMYGTGLKADMVSMSHHGAAGLEKKFYAFVAPDVVWWPHVTSSIYYDSSSDPGYLTMNNWYGKVSQFVFTALESVDHIYIADTYNITLTLTASGPQYDKVYEAVGGAVIGSSYQYELTRNVSQAVKVFCRPEVNRWHEQYGSLHEIHTKKPIIINKK